MAMGNLQTCRLAIGNLQTTTADRG